MQGLFPLACCNNNHSYIFLFDRTGDWSLIKNWVVKVAPGQSQEADMPLVLHPDVDKIALSGSSGKGMTIMKGDHENG